MNCWGRGNIAEAISNRQWNHPTSKVKGKWSNHLAISFLTYICIWDLKKILTLVYFRSNLFTRINCCSNEITYSIVYYGGYTFSMYSNNSLACLSYNSYYHALSKSPVEKGTIGIPIKILLLLVLPFKGHIMQNT